MASSLRADQGWRFASLLNNRAARGSCLTFAMKIMKWIPAVLTAIHGGFSLLLLAISHLMPMGGFGGGVGYATALLAFVINLPGILTLKQFYTSSASDGPLDMFIGSLGMIVITDIYIFLVLTILFWIIRKALGSANKGLVRTGDPQTARPSAQP